MGSDKLGPTQWRDVPEAVTQSWRFILDNSTEGLNLDAPCPVCGHRTLHRWFNLHKSRLTDAHGRQWVGSGSEWRWCSTCMTYEHSSGLVPAWRQSNLVVPEDELRHDPGPIESRRSRDHDPRKRSDRAGSGSGSDTGTVG